MSETFQSWYDKANNLFVRGQYNEAIECYDKALAIDPKSADTWYNKGLAFNELGKYHEAIECYDKALAINGKDAYTWYNKGLTLSNLGSYDEAIKCYDKALQLNSEYTNALNNKSHILVAIGEYAEAMKSYKKVLELEPQNISALKELSSLCSNYVYDYRYALELRKKLRQIQPESVRDIGIAEDLLKAGFYKDCRKYALNVADQTENTLEIIRSGYLILLSYFLEGDQIKGNEFLDNFLDYYKNADLAIKEEEWNFRGLIHLIDSKDIFLETKFVLHTIIDMLQGKIDKLHLSFYNTYILNK